MPIGVKFERKHKKLGYLAKYLYYCVAKRNILQKRISFGQMNSDRVIYVIKPDYQDGVEGLLSLINIRTLERTLASSLLLLMDTAHYSANIKMQLLDRKQTTPFYNSRRNSLYT